jgi:hypothetical protein
MPSSVGSAKWKRRRGDLSRQAAVPLAGGDILMKIDRRDFLFAAASMWALPSCVIRETTPAGPGAQYPANDPKGVAPASECVDWDATGECVGWAGDGAESGEPMEPLPADECVNWDPTGECIGWAGDSAAPANECVEWDPTGECIRWEAVAPANECVSWDPTGECIGWE